MKAEKEKMKPEQKSKVLFQIPLCSLHVSFGFSRCKTTKREEKGGKGWKNTHSHISYHWNHQQGITINSKEFQIQGLIPFSSWWLVSLLIIRADRKIWLWCVCCCSPLGRVRNSVFLRFIKFLLSVVVKLSTAGSSTAALSQKKKELD